MYQYWHLLVFLRAFPNALTFDQEGIIFIAIVFSHNTTKEIITVV
jgi:hypothetical protein